MHTSPTLHLPSPPRAVARRSLLAGGLALGAAGLAGCGSSLRPVEPTDPAVAETEAMRGSGPVRRHTLTARPTTLDLGGVRVQTWAYDEASPAQPIRVTLGDQLEVLLRNELPEATSVHWHGLALRNDMDGVPGVTQPMVMPGEEFTYRFTVATPGTHWFHPHHGTQLDRALYAPLVVEDPSDTGDYDVDAVAVLDDWTDGIGPDPDQVLQLLRDGQGGHGGMAGMGDMPGMGAGMGGGHAFGDWDYPAYVVNRRLPDDPDVLRAKPGARVRLRLVNAGADTVFDVDFDGAWVEVTHADGAAVQPVQTQALRMGMGERYDVVLTVPDRPLVVRAYPAGKAGVAGLVVAPRGTAAEAITRPAGPLRRHTVGYRELVPTAADRLPASEVDRELPVVLGGGMHSYVWTINGRTFDEQEPLPVEQGERVRLVVENHTMMWHPVHLHGHTFAVVEANGVRKDTVLVAPMGGLRLDLDADNPGQWMLHCHNAYHAEAGMMTTLSYVA